MASLKPLNINHKHLRVGTRVKLVPSELSHWSMHKQIGTIMGFSKNYVLVNYPTRKARDGFYFKYPEEIYSIDSRVGQQLHFQFN